jgi:hypothetical protein
METGRSTTRGKKPQNSAGSGSSLLICLGGKKKVEGMENRHKKAFNETHTLGGFSISIYLFISRDA